MKKTFIKSYKQFEFYKVSESKNRDSDIWIRSDEDLNYYIDPIQGYCRTIEDGKKFVDKFWEGIRR